MAVDIVISSEPRDPGQPPQTARFIARTAVGGRLLGAFTDPLCSSARVLLSEGVPREMVLRMRHAGSDVIALKSTVGVAAGLRVDEEGGTRTPRLAKWKPFDRSRALAAA